MSDVVERLRDLLAKAGDITIEWGAHYPWDANILFDGKPVAGVEADAIIDDEGDVEQLALAPATETIMEALLFLPDLLDELTTLRAELASAVAAVTAETERCARVAEGYEGPPFCARHTIAANIRKGG